jgi:hypothetical protein
MVKRSYVLISALAITFAGMVAFMSRVVTLRRKWKCHSRPSIATTASSVVRGICKKRLRSMPPEQLTYDFAGGDIEGIKGLLDRCDELLVNFPMRVRIHATYTRL